MEEAEKTILQHLSTILASRIADYVIERLKGRRIKTLEVKVRILDYEKLLFDIEVNVDTDLLVSDNTLKKVVEESVEYGFSILDKVMNYILSKNMKVSLDELERVIERYSRTSHGYSSQEHRL